MRSTWLVAQPKLIAEAIKRTELEVRTLNNVWQLGRLDYHNMTADVEQNRAIKRLKTLNALYAVEVQRNYNVEIINNKLQR